MNHLLRSNVSKSSRPGLRFVALWNITQRDGLLTLCASTCVWHKLSVVPPLSCRHIYLQSPPSEASQSPPPVLQHEHTVCGPVCTSRQWSSCAGCWLPERATLFHLWLGFRPTSQRVTHWVTWWSNWMGVYSCALQCLYFILFSMRAVLLPSISMLNCTNHCRCACEMSFCRVSSHFVHCKHGVNDQF